MPGRFVRPFRFVAGAAILLVAGAAAAIDTTTPFVGNFNGHNLAGTPGCTTTTTDQGKDGTVTVTFDCSSKAADAGLIHGTVTIDFPATTPIAHYDSTGARLVFDAPVVTHLTADYIWTALNKPNSDGQLTLDTYDSDQSADAPQCSFDSGDKKVAAGSTTDFHGSIECVWTSMHSFNGESVPFSTVPFVDLVSDSTFFAFSGGGGEYADHSFVSSYTFTQTAPPTADLTIDHVEVVQTVQNADDSLAAVADKFAAVRVFPKFTDSNANRTSIPGVTATLRGYHGSTELEDSPLTTNFNVGGAVAAVRTPNRDEEQDSINFILPFSWVAEGDLTLTATINPNHTVPETNYANDTATITKTFNKSRAYSIGYVPVCYLDFQHCPSNRITQYASLAASMYPIPEKGLSYTPLRAPRLLYPFTLTTTADNFSLLAFLKVVYYLNDAVAGGPDQLVGWLPHIGGEELFDGFSDPIYDGGKSKVLFGQDFAAFDNPANADIFRLGSYILAHEAGHNLGLRHTDKTENGDGCGAVDPLSDFAEYYTDGKATIHDPGYSLANSIFFPSGVKEVMSRCAENGVWVSGYHWEKLLAGIVGSTGVPNPTPENDVVVTGEVSDDGSAGTLSAVLELESSYGDPSDPAGRECLDFSASGGPSSPYCFDVAFDTETRGAGSGHASVAAFAVKAPLPPGTDRIALRIGATELAAISKSAHPPSVAITAPVAGTAWTGTKVLAWTASDADGDPLSFAVRTSSDAGAHWVPVAVGLTDTQLPIDSSVLAAGATTLFQVIASDGFDSTSATAGPFTVPAQRFVEATPALAFGPVAAGGHRTLSVLVTNGGDLDAHVTALTSSDSQFAAAPSAPILVPALGSASVAVTFTPAATGPVGGTLTLSVDDPARPSLRVALTGGGCVSHAGARCSAPVPVEPPAVVGGRSGS